MSKVIEIRNIDVIAAEICSIKDQTRKMVLGNSIEIGKRLAEAKDIIPHGSWGDWLQQSVDYSQSTANNLMRIFEEYGANQLTFFGSDAQSQTLGSLSYTQAIALLGVPADEREAFIENNDVESMSTRELQAAIKEKQELEKKLKEVEDREQAAISTRKLLSTKNDELQAESTRLREELDAAKSVGDNKATSKLKAEMKIHEKKLADSEKRIQELEDELVHTTIPKETEQELESLRKRGQELADQARRLEEATAVQVAGLQEQLAKNNNTAAIKFKLCFETLTSNFKDLIGSLHEIQDVTEKEKYQGAIAKLCDKMKGAV